MYIYIVLEELPQILNRVESRSLSGEAFERLIEKERQLLQELSGRSGQLDGSLNRLNCHTRKLKSNAHMHEK